MGMVGACGGSSLQGFAVWGSIIVYCHGRLQVGHLRTFGLDWRLRRFGQQGWLREHSVEEAVV